MNTRRGFMKTGLGCIGLGGLVGTSIINAKTIPPVKVLSDYDAGMRAGITAGKGGPFVGWDCIVKFEREPDPLAYPGILAPPGKLVNIDFKNKTFTVQCDMDNF